MTERHIELLALIVVHARRHGQAKSLFRLALELDRDYHQAHNDLRYLERRRLVKVRRKVAGSPLIIWPTRRTLRAGHERTL